MKSKVNDTGKVTVKAPVQGTVPGTVQGIATTAPRPTRAAAVMLALGLAIPVFLLLSLIEWLMF